MQALVRWLNANGSEVYLVQLCGHGREDVLKVTGGLWQEEVMDGYAAAQQASVQQAVPLYFMGYSLGALLGQSIIGLQTTQLPFQKQVLFSPAIHLRKHSYLLRHLFFLGEGFRLPSFTPGGYRANRWLPLRLYKILYDEEKKLLAAKGSLLNFPTLVFMDPKDELISYKSLETLLQQRQLSQWQLVPLHTGLQGRRGKYHHLILDEETMGSANWQMVTTAMQVFLFD